MLLGNLDHDMRAFLSRAADALIPFFAFALGSTLDLHRVWQAGLLGVALGLGVVAVSGTVLTILDRTAGGSGVAGIAAASTAANAAAVPAIVAAANPAYVAAAAPATVLVAASVIVTALLVPGVTVWWARRVAPLSLPAAAVPSSPAPTTTPRSRRDTPST
jgi:2-keto-3-deoxygluconate permease